MLKKDYPSFFLALIVPAGITEPGLEGTCRGHPVQVPCNEQGHLQLDQVVQSSVQPALECLLLAYSPAP